MTVALVVLGLPVHEQRMSGSVRLPITSRAEDHPDALAALIAAVAVCILIWVLSCG